MVKWYELPVVCSTRHVKMQGKDHKNRWLTMQTLFWIKVEWLCGYSGWVYALRLIQATHTITVKTFLSWRHTQTNRLTYDIAFMLFEELFNTSWSMVKVTNTTRPCPRDSISNYIYIFKTKRTTHVWACGSIKVMAPTRLTRPCRSTRRQVLLLSTTLWWANAARTCPMLVWLSPVWFVPNHLSSTYPGLPNGRRGVAGNILYIKLQL